MGNTFIRNLNILMKKSDEPIKIHMKSCGGDWNEGICIYDSIKACPNHITIISYTHARSMTSIIFQAADKRVMMEHSSFMFHTGTMGYSGTSKQFKTEAKELEKTTKQMLDIYVESMKFSGKYKDKSESYIRKWLIKQMDKYEEVYLTPQEAIELGFADEIYIGNM
jgi:ATP-dependent protease ClpP protease subunit